MKATMIGLDIAKNVFQLHGIDAARQPVFKKRLSRRGLFDFLNKQTPCRIGLEACGTAHYFGRELKKLGHDVQLLPPHVVKAFVKAGHKTDAMDARAICLAMQQPDIASVPVKSEEQQAQRFLHRSRELLNGQHTQTANHLRSLCAELGHVCAKGFAPLHALLDQIVTGAIATPNVFRDIVKNEYEHLKALEERARQVAASITQQARGDAKARRLMDIPGVGPVIAHALVSGIVETERFSSARKFAAFLGLVPSINASGSRRRLGRMTLAGDESMRSLLVCGASSIVKLAKQRPDRVDPSIVKLLERRPYKVVVGAVAARMARTAWAMLNSGQEYRPRYTRARPAPQAQPEKPAHGEQHDGK